MEKVKLVNNEEFRQKVVTLLKLYGYYDGVLVKSDMDKKFISGECGLIDIILSKKDFKELKRSINKVLDYCYENSFEELEKVMNFFYKEICRDIRKQYGNFFEKLN